MTLVTIRVPGELHPNRGASVVLDQGCTPHRRSLCRINRRQDLVSGQSRGADRPPSRVTRYLPSLPLVAENDSMTSHDPLPFGPTASWDRLRLRAQMLRNLRQSFEQRGFLEVETPLLSMDTVVDRHLEPLSVELPGIEAPRRWLQTSPEFSMKRLLAAGAPAIYQIGRAFRSGERGPLHNPEFTIVEWYRTGDTPDQAMHTLSELVEEALGCQPAERISYQDAFSKHVGLDPHAASIERLRDIAVERKIQIPPSFAADRDEWLNLLLTTFVEPQLGRVRPTILFDYPSSQSALARVRSDKPPVAERFELYLNGIELANGYHELCDPVELRQRIAETNLLRKTDGNGPLPEENRLLAAMEHGLPPCCGAALGFDRLVMLAADARTIDEVLTFPFERA